MSLPLGPDAASRLSGMIMARENGVGRSGLGILGWLRRSLATLVVLPLGVPFLACLGTLFRSGWRSSAAACSSCAGGARPSRHGRHDAMGGSLRTPPLAPAKPGTTPGGVAAWRAVRP